MYIIHISQALTLCHSHICKNVAILFMEIVENKKTIKKFQGLVLVCECVYSGSGVGGSVEKANRKQKGHVYLSKGTIAYKMYFCLVLLYLHMNFVYFQ